jgi:hypothetical protein
MTPKQRNYTVRKQRACSGRRLRIWQAMRIMREFSTPDLAATCELKNHRVALAYISALRRAGYVRTRQPQRGQHVPAIHTLIRNSGPKAPAIVRKGVFVWDPNTDTEYRIRDEQEPAQ